MKLNCYVAACAALTFASPLLSLASTPTPNPYLAAPVYAITHNDPSASDSFPYAVGTGTSYVTPSLLPQSIGGPINIYTLASTSSNYMWGVSSTGVTYINVANGGFLPVAHLLLPNQVALTSALVTSVLSQPLNTLSDVSQLISNLGIPSSSGGIGGVPGTYTLVDNNNVLYYNAGKYIYALGLTVPAVPALGISILRSLDTSAFMTSGESIVGVSLTYDGKLIVVGAHSISVVDRNFVNPVQTIQFPGENISNSIAVDENNGIYVISDTLMRKLVWTGTMLSQVATDGAWSSTYPTGDTYPTLFGSGSGSTPTLMGFGSDPDHLVVVTDGLSHMSLIAFWRDAIPAGFTSRTAGSIPVTCGFSPLPAYIQSDQSVAVTGYGAFVVNNVSTGEAVGDNIELYSLAAGPVIPSPLGVQRFQWDTTAHTWSSTWARPDISSNSMVPGVSSASNIVFVSGYYSSTGWKVTGLDWSTGATVTRIIFGPGLLGDGDYALMQFLPNGDLLFNSIIGPARVTLPSGAVLP